MKKFFLFFSLLFLTACGGDTASSDNKIAANITKVAVLGTENNYTFEISIQSDETGCDQYADWWEVLTEEEVLIYRRILAHSHPKEQPFTRSGGPIEIAQDTIVYIRAHMNSHSYSGDVFKGSVRSGFVKVDQLPAFSSDIEKSAPLPDECAF